MIIDTVFSVKRKQKTGHSQRTAFGRGRGSGKGKTAGRGHKGQKARGARSVVSTRGFEGGQTPLYRRMPRVGFVNIFRTENDIISFEKIAKIVETLNVKNITRQFLIDIGFIKSARKLKLLANGEPIKGVSVEVDFASEAALEKAKKGGVDVKIISK